MTASLAVAHGPVPSPERPGADADAARALLQVPVGATPDTIAAAHARLDAGLADPSSCALAPGLRGRVAQQRARLAAARDTLLAEAAGRAVPAAAPRAGAAGLPGRDAVSHAGDAAASMDDDLVGTVLARRYEVLEFIGEGGMGRVFRAFDRLKQSYVAVKAISSELVRQKSAQERFVTEAKLACSLSHPNIIRVHDVCAEDDGYFITMELLHGQTLRAKLEQQKCARRPFPLEQGLQMARELLAGLAFAHQQLVHRDIKPENIWVCDDGTVKLMDFGVAQSIQGDRRTRTLQSVGSAYYVAPEQLRGLELDQRSDQYSLAVVLYELFAGRMPTGVVKPLQALRPDLPAAAAAAVMKALSPSPEERFATTDALRARFERTSAWVPSGTVVRIALGATLVLALAGAAAVLVPRTALQRIHLVETTQDREGAIEAQAAVQQLFARADAVAPERQATLHALQEHGRSDDTAAKAGEPSRVQAELDLWSGLAYPAATQIEMHSRRAIADAAFKEGRFFEAHETYGQLRAWLEPRVAAIPRLPDLARARAAALAAASTRGSGDPQAAQAAERFRHGDERLGEARADEALAAYRDAVALVEAVQARTRERDDAAARSRATESRQRAQAQDAALLAASRAREAASAADAARRAEQLRVGRQFHDRLASGGQGPEMVVAPAAAGRSLDDAGSASRDVLARSVRAIDAADLARFQRASGHASQAQQLAALYRDDAPPAAANVVTPADAQAYAAWLSGETGQRYRVARTARASDVGVTFWVARDLAP